jgi:hypothetical protein
LITLRAILNVLIVVLLLIVGYLSYSFFSKDRAVSSQPPRVDSAAAITTKPVRVVQLDVLNGCGVKGAGINVTKFLRTNGFDVVEVKNYKTPHVPQTLVVDRVGNLAMAKQVAMALGVEGKNVVQQINPDYYVDVSVIIGKDFADLRISQTK